MTQISLRTSGVDVGYVEERLGREFYSQLRGTSRVAEFRRAAVARAHGLYEEAAANGAPEPEITGLGLLVLQRALLACEDLGALLYALAEEPHWLRFTSYRAEDLDAIYALILERGVDVRDLWGMPTDEAIASESGHSEVQREAFKKLRELTATELESELEVVANFWTRNRTAIKNVMHGFSVVPATYLVEPPGAGVLSKQVELGHERPFAASLVSEVNDEERSVETTTYTVDLNAAAITAVRDIADSACTLLDRLADAWRVSVSTRHAFILRDDLAHRLSPEEQEAVADFMIGEDDAKAT
jgi:hypothetical protein